MLRALDDALGALPQPDSRFERDRWRIVSRAVYYAVEPLIAAAAIVGHEHAWARCAACPHDGPCACAGGICCPGEQRENEARAEGAASERERIRALAIKHGAVYHKWIEGGPAREQWLFADLLGEDASG